VAAALNHDGYACSMGLGGRTRCASRAWSQSSRRAYKRTTVPGQHPVNSPDLIGRDHARSVWAATGPDGAVVNKAVLQRTVPELIHAAGLAEYTTCLRVLQEIHEV
jgi:hypothetical protein